MSIHKRTSSAQDVEPALLAELAKEEAVLTDAANRLTEGKRVVSKLERRVDILRRAAEAYDDLYERCDGNHHQ